MSQLLRLFQDKRAKIHHHVDTLCLDGRWYHLLWDIPICDFAKRQYIYNCCNFGINAGEFFQWLVSFFLHFVKEREREYKDNISASLFYSKNIILSCGNQDLGNGKKRGTEQKESNVQPYKEQCSSSLEGINIGRGNLVLRPQS